MSWIILFLDFCIECAKTTLQCQKGSLPEKQVVQRSVAINIRLSEEVDRVDERPVDTARRTVVINPSRSSLEVQSVGVYHDWRVYRWVKLRVNVVAHGSSKHSAGADS